MDQKELYRLLKKPAGRRSKDEIQRIAESVSGVSFFQNLGVDMRHRCCGSLLYEQYRPGMVIFEEGSAGSRFYVVLEGTVAIYVNEVAAQELTNPEEVARVAAIQEQSRRRSLERQRLLEEGLRQRLASATEQGTVSSTRRVVVKTPSNHGSEPSSSDSSSDDDDEDVLTPEASVPDLGNLLIRRTRLLSMSAGRSRNGPPMARPLDGLREVARLEQGAAFGEVALMTDQPRTATVRALVATHVAVLERSDYQHILARAFHEDRQGRLDFIARVPFFSGWGVQELERLSSMMYRREMRMNEVLYEAGSSTVQVYFVQEGEFAVSRSAEAAAEELAGSEGAGVEANSTNSMRRRMSAGVHLAGSSEGGSPPSASSIGSAAGGPRRRPRRFLLGPAGARLQAGWECKPARKCWATVALVTPPHTLGLMAYLCGAKVHSERAICRSYKGCVYGIYAKELIGQLDMTTRAQILKGALSQDQFLKARAQVVGELLLAQSGGAHGVGGPCFGTARHTPSVYTPRGRLQIIASVVGCAGMAASNGPSPPSYPRQPGGPADELASENTAAEEAPSLHGAGLPGPWRTVLHGAAAWPSPQHCSARRAGPSHRPSASRPSAGRARSMSTRGGVEECEVPHSEQEAPPVAELPRLLGSERRAHAAFQVSACGAGSCHDGMCGAGSSPQGDRPITARAMEEEPKRKVVVSGSPVHSLVAELFSPALLATLAGAPLPQSHTAAPKGLRGKASSARQSLASSDELVDLSSLYVLQRKGSAAPRPRVGL